MDFLWFGIVVMMLGIYVVLDGFDFGVGILLRFVAHSDQERQIALSSIGPFRDGNEVWLVAAGGVLFMAFPKVYANAFSGFYLALMIVLWLLILRGVSMEFRSHQQNLLWREFCDTVFSLASGTLAFVLGTALGNLVRGVPISEAGLSGMPLFTNFQPGKNAGILDWYTGLVGVFSLVALAGHGAIYLDWRTTGPVQFRSREATRFIWRILLPFWTTVTVATAFIQPEVFWNLITRVWPVPIGLLALVGFAGVHHFLRTEQPFCAFLSSSVFLFCLLATTMIGNYPYWLRSTLDSATSLTTENSVSAAYGLEGAVTWWAFGMLLAVSYFACLFGSMQYNVIAAARDSD